MPGMHRFLISFLLVVAMVATACGGGDDATSDTTGSTESAGDPDVGVAGPSGEPREGGTLRVALHNDSNGYDPASAQWGAAGIQVASAVFDTLVAWDENGEAKPYLAESFEPNDDLTQWTIVPREGVTFHNGEALTAEVIAANIERFRTSPLLQAALGDVESIEVVAGTVVLTLTRPRANYNAIFTRQPGMMVAQEMLDDPEAFASKPIGTGPFVFDSWVVDDQLTVTRNPDYWNGPVYLDGIEFRVIADQDARDASLQAGDFDAVIVFDAGQILELEDQDLQVFVPGVERQEVLLLMNLDQPPLDDIRVREATVLAIDRQLGIDTLDEGLYEPASGPWSPESPWYADTNYPDPDAERARQLVEEWEAETGRDLTIDLRVPQDPPTIRSMQFVAEQLGDVGIDVELVTSEGAVNTRSILTGDYEVAAWRFYDRPHPEMEYQFLHSSSAPETGLALNFGRMRDEAVDAALDGALVESDGEQLREYYAEVQQAMTDGFYMAWLYHDMNVLVAQPDVGNVTVWTFPDGTPGQPLSGGMVTRWTSTWLDR